VKLVKHRMVIGTDHGDERRRRRGTSFGGAASAEP
jgi:hypothetical protein